METWMGYFILGFALSTPIGPVNIEMIRQGISSGFYPSWLVGLGDVISNLLIVGIIFSGFSSGIVDLSYLSFIAIAGRRLPDLFGDVESENQVVHFVMAPACPSPCQGICPWVHQSHGFSLLVRCVQHHS